MENCSESLQPHQQVLPCPWGSNWHKHEKGSGLSMCKLPGWRGGKKLMYILGEEADSSEHGFSALPPSWDWLRAPTCQDQRPAALLLLLWLSPLNSSQTLQTHFLLPIPAPSLHPTPRMRQTSVSIRQSHCHPGFGQMGSRDGSCKAADEVRTQHDAGAEQLPG